MARKKHSLTCNYCRRPFTSRTATVRFCSKRCGGLSMFPAAKDRFLANVARRGPDECWLWTAGVNAADYGHFRDRGKDVRANRFAWELEYGPIPEGMEVCHTCDVPRCCNPRHLFLDSHQGNMRDMANKGRARYIVRLGEENIFSKMTDEKVLGIRAATGRLQDIADQFGCSKSNVFWIRKGKTWKHLLGAAA